MAVFRVHKTKNYTLMSNHHLRDKDLSLKAKGLLSVMFSLPDSWNYSIPGLCAILKENETAVKSTIKELKATGYLIVDKKKPCKEEGRSKFEYIYNIYETPHEVSDNSNNQEAFFQGIETLALEVPEVEHHPHNKRTDISTTDKSITDKSITDTDKDCTLSSTEEKTLPSSGKGVKTSAPNNNINININNIPPRTKEQKQERYAHAKNNRSVDYKDEELPTILYNGFNSLYGDKEDILKDHDICLTMALVKQFFEKFKQYRGERHPMVYANDLDQFLSMIRNADLDMVKDGIVEEDEEPQYYLDMMDEYFGSDIGKNNNMDCDYHIWLFFTEKTQNILYNRVKQKREE
ncbi:helix-turn-helix domain-containing protein [Blautia obeum]|nr:helix-turn-helix domain-containing protein [Blautia obeum]